MAAIEVITIDPDEVVKLLSRSEGHFFDFKSKVVSPAKLSRSISAFANADGGELLIGVDENAGAFQWNGFGAPEDANAIVQVVEETCPIGPGLASPEDSIMEYLETHDTISNGQARELCVIREDWRIRSIFGRMVEAGMIEKVPGSTTSNTAYRKIGK